MSLLPAPDANEMVIEVTDGLGSFQVTRDARDSMSYALDSMANQPTVYYRCKFAIIAVAKILKVDMLQYSMPQLPADLSTFSWDRVTIGDWDTYPKGNSPSKEEFAKVKSVHEAVKAEKDAEARKRGLSKSGVQSYVTYKQNGGSGVTSWLFTVTCIQQKTLTWSTLGLKANSSLPRAKRESR